MNRKNLFTRFFFTVVAVSLLSGLAAAQDTPKTSSKASSTMAASSDLLDINSATKDQLDALPGIGPTTAQKILDYRQAHGSFHSLAELDAVPGIGQGRIEQLKGLVLP